MQTRTKKLIIRWSMVTAGAFALFWSIYYLKVGFVPIVANVEIIRGWTIDFPFSISRWWDILIIPICSVSIFIFVNLKKEDWLDEDLDTFLFSYPGDLTLPALLALLVILCMSTLPLVHSLVMCFILICIFTSIIPTESFLGNYPVSSIGAGLGIVLGMGLSNGLLVGLAFIPVIVAFILLNIFLLKFQKGVTSWLLATEQSQQTKGDKHAN